MLLHLDGTGPLYRQVYRAIRGAILEGVLSPGSRLPATRTLAGHLNVSRNTVIQAFEQLEVEGYVTMRKGSGTYVAEEVPENALSVRRAGATAPGQGSTSGSSGTALALSSAARRLERMQPRADHLSWDIPGRGALCDFRYGVPAFDDLPMTTWSRLVARRTRDASLRRLRYGSPAGAAELREALAAYLRRSRGVNCSPDGIVITWGTQQAVNLVADALIDPGDRVAIEEPHYPGFTLPLRARGAELLSIPAAERGLSVPELEARGPVKLICVTPSHQFPSGALMPLAHRLELLQVADRFGAVVLEDDYDSEFRYDGRPVETLQGLDTTGRVAYVGSVSKMLFPALRIGWLIAPEELVAPILRAKAVADTGTPTLEQLALADFISGGHLERHVRRQRVRNQARRDVLLAELDRHLGDRALVQGAEAGVHLVLWLNDTTPEQGDRIRRVCRERGVGVYPVAPMYAAAPERAGFVVGYAALREEEIVRGVGLFADVVREVRPTAH